MKLSSNYIFLFLLIFGVLPISFTYFNATQKEYRKINSFDDCVQAGVAVVPTYPETCRVPGKVFTNPKQKVTTQNFNDATNSETTIHDVSDPRNNTYFIDGQQVSLHNGIGILPPNSINRPTTTINVSNGFAQFDLNKDLVKDKVFLLVLTTEDEKKESFYLATLLSLYKGYIGSNALFLGTDISSTTISFKDDMLKVVYNQKNESGTVAQIKKYFILKDELIQEVKH